MDTTADAASRPRLSKHLPSERTTKWSPGWLAPRSEDWRRILAQAPNPLWPPTIDLVRDAIGSQTEAYLEFMMSGVDLGGYRFTCPGAYLTGPR